MRNDTLHCDELLHHADYGCFMAGAKEALLMHGVVETNIDVYYVPGAFEILRWLQGSFDAKV